MGESIDVKALRAKFNSKASTSDTSSRDSGSPKSPRPGFGRAILPVTESNLAQHRLSPTYPLTPPMADPGLMRAEPMTAPLPPRPVSFPRPPPNPGFRSYAPLTDTNKVKQTGEMLQNMMLRHPKPPGISPAAVPAQAHATTPTSTTLPLRQQPRQRSTGDVTPLRKPLPREGPMPLKPKRPPNVNLEPFLKFNQGSGPRKQGGGSPGRKMSLPAVLSPPQPPQRSSKPRRLPRQGASVCHDLQQRWQTGNSVRDIEDNQDTYDDIENCIKNESWSDGSQCFEEDNEDVYESIDEDTVDANLTNAEKKNKKPPEPEKKDQMENQKKENDFRKNIQSQGEDEIIHTARVRHDWYGEGKLDLNVRKGESVEIVRTNNNPVGKWWARTLNGKYGYISNTCVDIDYEAVKRKVLQSRKTDTLPLPPPPPDPPQMLNMESNNRDSIIEDDDDYDDVQPLTEDFPPPPPEVSIDSKVMKELRKKFKFEGPLNVLHTVMVDPNGVIKKPGGKDLPVTSGEVLDIIQLTNSKKALCRNRFGKYGYVSRSLLLSMERDIYDDVDYAGDIYDNDSPHTDY